MVVAPAPAAGQETVSSREFIGIPPMATEQSEVIEPFAERHYTVNELASIWHLSGEFVRQLIQHEPGVTEWVRQQPGRRRYRVLRIPQSVAERVYRRAMGKAREEATRGVGTTRAR
jgi:hypothetical protein